MNIEQISSSNTPKLSIASILPLADFQEGVRALLVDRDEAKWSHASVEDVGVELVEKYFEPLPAGHLTGDLPI